MGCPFPEHHRAPSGGGPSRAMLGVLAVLVLAVMARAAERAAVAVLALAEIAAVILAALSLVAVAIVITRRRARARAISRAASYRIAAAVLPAEAGQIAAPDFFEVIDALPPGEILGALPAPPRISASAQPRTPAPARQRCPHGRRRY